MVLAVVDYGKMEKNKIVYNLIFVPIENNDKQTLDTTT